jgi:hypothetical protein
MGARNDNGALGHISRNERLDPFTASNVQLHHDQRGRLTQMPAECTIVVRLRVARRWLL